MNVSIINVVFNNKNYIEDALLSIIGQDYPLIQLIVIDGGSTDGTLEILYKYKKYINILISEKDKGIYDAMNKGLQLADGDIIGYLHSDDVLATSNTISKIVKSFSENDSDVIYGNLNYVSRTNQNKIIRNWVSCNFNKRLLYYGWMPPHPTLYFKRELQKKVGFFNTRYKISADYEYMLRIFLNPKTKSLYIPEVLVDMKVGGKSNSSIKNIIIKLKEDFKIIKIHNIGNILTLLLKNISKFKQFV